MNHRRLIKLVVATTLVFSGCGFFGVSGDLRQIQSYISSKEYAKAVSLYEKILRVYPKDPRVQAVGLNAAELASIQLGDPSRALKLLRQIVINSNNEALVLKGQKKIAEIYFEKIQDYRLAIEAYNKLLTRPIATTEQVEFRTNLAKAYYATGEFYQSQLELDSILKLPLDPQNRFELLSLKAQILITLKNNAEAIKIYQDLLRDYPSQSKEAKTVQSLSVAYEETGNIDKAVEVLSRIPAEGNEKEVLQLKMERLNQRRQNLPGAEGFHK